MMRLPELVLGLVLVPSVMVAAETENDRASYDWLTQLDGQWMLSPADQQEGKATQHKLVVPLVGTDAVAMNFKVIGKGSTVQESLLPDTKKEMVTMYHCGDTECSQVRATHYCVKQNQPRLIVDTNASNDSLMLLECDMDTAVCQSKLNHVHRITHELSAEGKHLKTTYTSYADGKHLKDSVYHFDRQ